MSNKSKTERSNELQWVNNFVIFETENDKVNIDVYFQDETLWLTQNFFTTSKQNIGRHISNILEDRELGANSVVKNYLITDFDGKSCNVTFYSAPNL